MLVGAALSSRFHAVAGAAAWRVEDYDDEFATTVLRLIP
jgi:hypothetical protein